MVAPEFVHDLGEAIAFSRRDEVDAQTLGVQPDVLDQPLAQLHHAHGVEVAVRRVVALVQVASGDGHAVGAVGERAQHVGHVDPARAHDPDESRLGAVLKSGYTSQVRRPVTSPVADEADDASA